MPPSRKSSSSRSSRSRSRSSRSRSSSSSSRRHSSSSHSSSSQRRSSVSSQRVRYNQPTGVPAHIISKAICMNCRNHTYVYYSEPWVDNNKGITYQKGYYDETGKYYDADDIVFKNQDGSYTAHFVCEYCGSEADLAWKEGVYPTCSSCGAQMNKELTYVDDIIQVESYQSTQRAQETSGKTAGIIKKILIGYIVAIFAIVILGNIFAAISLWHSFDAFDDVTGVSYVTDSDAEEYHEVSNIDIYGTDIYLDEVGDNTYVICDETDDYEKHLTWDYGADSYYDYDSECYLWYNTDVSPNLWQYWYEEIAGSDYYGWMECEGSSWYIEVSDTEWEEYTGDTSKLWHIQNAFD